MVHKYGHLFRYCSQRDWYGWDGKRWVPDSEGKIHQAASRTVREIKRELPLHLEAAEGDKERAAITKSVLDWALAERKQKPPRCDGVSNPHSRTNDERYKSWTKDTNEFVMKERRFNEAMDDHQYKHTKRDNKKLYTGFRLRDPMEKFAEKYGRTEMVLDDVYVF